MTTISKRLIRKCSICGKKISATIYSDRSYKGGVYFGKIGMYTEKVMNKALKAGSRPANSGSKNIRVLNKDPILYKYVEYWECLKCDKEAYLESLKEPI